jgi:hypothetical protein
MKCWPWHKWSKWKTYKWTGLKYDSWGPIGIQVTETRQCRVCETCGIEKHRVVSEAAGGMYDAVTEV